MGHICSTFPCTSQGRPKAKGRPRAWNWAAARRCNWIHSAKDALPASDSWRTTKFCQAGNTMNIYELWHDAWCWHILMLERCRPVMHPLLSPRVRRNKANGQLPPFSHALIAALKLTSLVVHVTKALRKENTQLKLKNTHTHIYIYVYIYIT